MPHHPPAPRHVTISQHPPPPHTQTHPYPHPHPSLVVNASYAVDTMLAETEQGRAVKAIAAVDAGFDPYTFVQDMQERLMPALARAFFTLDMPSLRRMCRDSALAQMKSVAAARAVEGLTHDGIVLNVSKCEMGAGRTLEGVEGGGTLPVILTTAQVQYIHTVRNGKVSGRGAWGERRGRMGGGCGAACCPHTSKATRPRCPVWAPRGRAVHKNVLHTLRRGPPFKSVAPAGPGHTARAGLPPPAVRLAGTAHSRCP